MCLPAAKFLLNREDTQILPSFLKILQRSFLFLEIPGAFFFPAFVFSFVSSMPPRSVLLNVSITSKGLGHEQPVRSEEPHYVNMGAAKMGGPEEGKRDRVDSATSGKCA